MNAQEQIAALEKAREVLLQIVDKLPMPPIEDREFINTIILKTGIDSLELIIKELKNDRS